MKAATCKRLAKNKVSLTLAGSWSVADAAELNAQLEAELPAKAKWQLDAAELEAVDLAIWQILYRYARTRPGFACPTEAPCLDELSQRLGLPVPASWTTA